MGSIVCAVMLCIFVWSIRPHSFGPWITEKAAFWAAFFFVPIATVLWAVAPASPWHTASYIWLRRLIQFHIVLTALIVLAACTPLGSALGLAPSWTLYGILGIGAIVADGLVLLFAPASNASPEDIATYRRWQFRIAGGITAAIAIWSFLNIAIMTAQAQIIAAGRPYCIQVAKDNHGRYKPVQSLMDMNGLKMNAPFSRGGSSDFQFAFHAVLSIEREFNIEWRHWSYRQQRFVPFKETSAWPTQVRIREGKGCERKPNFAKGLSPF
jgi:hypothetical protein